MAMKMKIDVCQAVILYPKMSSQEEGCGIVCARTMVLGQGLSSGPRYIFLVNASAMQDTMNPPHWP